MATSVEEVAQLLTQQALTIAVAEACTAGLVGHLLCSVPGSSRYFPGGVIAYSGGSKTRVLGIPEELLRRETSVSRITALQMAQRARQLFDTDLGVSTTGVAGPTGGTPQRPVGLFYVAVVARDGYEACNEYRWNSDRMKNKELTAQAALEMVKEYLVRK